MKLAVFRTEADGRRTARALSVKGHDAVLAPVIAIVPLVASHPPDDANAVVFTSAHGPPACSEALRAALADKPCFCVGARTAAAATTAGFAPESTVAGDAQDLAVAIGAALPRMARIALLAGHDRKPVLEDTLAQAGFSVAVTEIYAAAETAAWPPDLVDALARCDGALHYSRRSAELAMARLGQAGLAVRARGWDHYCLSADVAAGVRSGGGTALIIAERPDEPALLAML